MLDFGRLRVGSEHHSVSTGLPCLECVANIYLARAGSWSMITARAKELWHVKPRL